MHHRWSETLGRARVRLLYQGSHHLHILHYLISLFSPIAVICFVPDMLLESWRLHGVEDHTPFSDGACNKEHISTGMCYH